MALTCLAFAPWCRLRLVSQLPFGTGDRVMVVSGSSQAQCGKGIEGFEVAPDADSFTGSGASHVAHFYMVSEGQPGPLIVCYCHQ
ncbi:unnamed protein product, partial [Prorocentrum cordatum]